MSRCYNIDNIVQTLREKLGGAIQVYSLDCSETKNRKFLHPTLSCERKPDILVIRPLRRSKIKRHYIAIEVKLCMRSKHINMRTLQRKVINKFENLRASEYSALRSKILIIPAHLRISSRLREYLAKHRIEVYGVVGKNYEEEIVDIVRRMKR